MKITTKLLVVSTALVACYLFYQPFDSGPVLSAPHSVQISRPLLDSDFETQNKSLAPTDEQFDVGDVVVVPESTQVEVSLGDYIDPEVLVPSVSEQADINIGDYIDPEELPFQNDNVEDVNIGENLDPEDLPVTTLNTEEINIGPTLDAEEIPLDDTEHVGEPTLNTQSQIIP